MLRRPRGRPSLAGRMEGLQTNGKGAEAGRRLPFRLTLPPVASLSNCGNWKEAG